MNDIPYLVLVVQLIGKYEDIDFPNSNQVASSNYLINEYRCKNRQEYLTKRISLKRQTTDLSNAINLPLKVEKTLNV